MITLILKIIEVTRHKYYHNILTCLISGNSSITEPSNQLVQVTPQQDVQQDGRELLDMDIDFLELTLSQENIVQRHFAASLGTHNTMELQHSQSNSNYGAPVYNFSNSVVHIHHH